MSVRAGRLKAKFIFELSEENYNSEKLKKFQSMHIDSQYKKVVSENRL
jgi:hypothetical protein